MVCCEHTGLPPCFWGGDSQAVGGVRQTNKRQHDEMTTCRDLYRHYCAAGDSGAQHRPQECERCHGAQPGGGHDEPRGHRRLVSSCWKDEPHQITSLSSLPQACHAASARMRHRKARYELRLHLAELGALLGGVSATCSTPNTLDNVRQGHLQANLVAAPALGVHLASWHVCQCSRSCKVPAPCVNAAQAVGASVAGYASQQRLGGGGTGGIRGGPRGDMAGAPCGGGRARRRRRSPALWRR